MTADLHDDLVPGWHLDQVIERLGDLIDALNDELQHEVCHATAVREAVVAAIEAIGDERYEPYLSEWWLGGDR